MILDQIFNKGYYIRIKEMQLLEKIFYELGNYGPIFLIVRSLVLLRKKEIYFNYYLLGSFINVIVNQILKVIMKEPRPSVDKKTFDLALKYAKNNDYIGSISYDAFGMPSGHAQSVMFSTTYIFLVLKNENIYTMLFYLLITLITLIQRVQYNFHTINQVIVGSLNGILFAYIFYYLASGKLKGSLKSKKDDYGPI
jgi:membrane-associated phospholipid phosphatase